MSACEESEDMISYWLIQMFNINEFLSWKLFNDNFFGENKVTSFNADHLKINLIKYNFNA